MGSNVQITTIKGIGRREEKTKGADERGNRKHEETDCAQRKSKEGEKEEG